MIERISLLSNTHFGPGAALELPDWLEREGFRRPLILVDSSVGASEPGAALLAALGQRFAQAEIRSLRFQHEPTYAFLDELGILVSPSNPDVLVGIGGGSCLDVAKGVGVLLRNPGPAIRYRGMDKVDVPGVPVVLVPTTAGTGSEVTHTASFIDSDTGTKLGINGRHVSCRFAVLDPVLTVSCPKWVTVSSGLDVLVHAVEAVTSTAATSVSIFLGLEAVRLIYDALPVAVQSPQNLQARADALLASHYAGLAMANAGGGPASGISYPLGVHFKVPHGFAGGLLLGSVIDANVARGYTDGYARIYERLSVADPSLTDDTARARAFADAMRAFYRRLDSPTNLSEWKVGKSDVAHLTQLTMQQRRANLELNPVPFGEDDVVALLADLTV